MPHFNADTAKSLHDPIEFTLGGERYQLISLTPEVREEIRAHGEAMEISEATLEEALAGTLAIYTGQPKEVFLEATLRELSGTLNWIGEQLMDPRATGKAKKVLK